MEDNITPDSDRVNELIKKLAYMSKAGSEKGERESAKNKLNEVCMKYGIDYEDVDDLESSTKSFKYANNESKYLLSHCIWDVLPEAEITSESKTRELFVVANLSQQIEIAERYKHYWKAYRKEKETFATAFVLKNNIGVKINNEPSEPNNKEKQVKLTVMMSGIDGEPYLETKEQKQIK
jgi:hypothetical protein